MTASAFSRSLRTLEMDGSRWLWGTGLVASALLAGWTYWALRVPVSVFEVTNAARLEIERATYPIQSPATGRIVSNRLDRGREVQQGDVLLELESQQEKLAIREQEMKLAAIPPELEKLREQVHAEETARGVERQSSRVAITEAEERVREVEAPLSYAAADVNRTRDLQREGLAATREMEKAESEARRLRSAARSAGIVVTRLAEEQQARDSERAVRIQKIATDIARLEGDRRTAEALLRSVQYQVERRLLRAPVSGRIGESATLQTGAVITEGQILGVIVPHGRLQIVAQFPPPVALGRIHGGQRARMRLDGYPWVEFGAIDARVVRVADEVRDGSVRVDLTVVDSPGLKVELKHAMPGAVEVEVERIPPAALLLRSAGKSLASPLGTSLQGPR